MTNFVLFYFVFVFVFVCLFVFWLKTTLLISLRYCGLREKYQDFVQPLVAFLITTSFIRYMLRAFMLSQLFCLFIFFSLL